MPALNGGCRTNPRSPRLRVGSKNPKVVTRPRRAVLCLGAPSAFHGHHSGRRPCFRKRLCATATVPCRCLGLDDQHARSRARTMHHASNPHSYVPVLWHGPSIAARHCDSCGQTLTDAVVSTCPPLDRSRRFALRLVASGGRLPAGLDLAEAPDREREDPHHDKQPRDDEPGLVNVEVGHVVAEPTVEVQLAG